VLSVTLAGVRSFVSCHLPVRGGPYDETGTDCCGGRACPDMCGLPVKFLITLSSSVGMPGVEDSNIAAYSILNNPPTNSTIEDIATAHGSSLKATESIAMIGTTKKVIRKIKRPCFRPRLFGDETLPGFDATAGVSPPV